MTRNNNLERLNFKMDRLLGSNQEILISNARLEAIVQKQLIEVEELKNMLRSFIENNTVTQDSVNVAIESHSEPTLEEPRKRDVFKKWKKIERPDLIRVRPRHRLEEFIRDYKTFYHTSGSRMSAAEAEEMVHSEVGCLQVFAHAECSKMEHFLTSTYQKEFVWSKIPKELIFKHATALEKHAADRRTYLDRCKFQWAAYGLLAESWANNFNPNCTNKKGKKRQRLAGPGANVSEENEEEEEEENYETYTSWRKMVELHSNENEESSLAEGEEMSVENGSE